VLLTASLRDAEEREAQAQAKVTAWLQVASGSALGDGPTPTDECNVEEVGEGNLLEDEGEKGVRGWERPRVLGEEERGEEVPLISGPHMSDGPPQHFYPAQHAT
jgi:hypothetical protein